jgi:hypothetical protein
MADGIKMQCPIWERSSEPGKVFHGQIAIDSPKRIQVYDDIRWPSAPFPELYILLAGAGVKLQPIIGRNNNFKMRKITVMASTATAFHSVIHAGEVFTSILSQEDCSAVIGILNSWTKSKSKSK